MDCPLCNNYLNLKIDREYFHCTLCRALVKDRQLFPKPSEEKKKYLEHNNDVNDLRYQAFTMPITQYILQNFSPEQQGLDFGSGTGPVISKMLEEQNYNVRQYDPYFANVPELLKERYDFIFACEVAEHFYYPEKEFQRLRTMLKPGGELILMTLIYSDTIHFQNWHYRKDPTHVFIYTEPTFQYIKDRFYFKSVEIQKRLIVLKANEDQKKNQMLTYEI